MRQNYKIMRQAQIPRGMRGLGLEVDPTYLVMGVGVLVLASFLFGGGDARRPLNTKRGAGRGGKRKTALDSVDQDVVSALNNLGYSNADARKAVASAKRKGSTGFNSIFEAAQDALA